MIPAPNDRTRITTRTGYTGTLIGWSDDGHTLIVRNDLDGGLDDIRREDVAFHEDEVAPVQYVPAVGWQLAGTNPDGTIWTDHIAAWAIKDNTGEPVVPKPDKPAISTEVMQDRSFTGCWLVPPGTTPEASPYRPNATN